MECRPAPTEAEPRDWPAWQRRQPGGLQRAVHDQAWIAFLVADIVHVVVDAVAVAGQGRIPEQQHRVRHDCCLLCSLHGGGGRGRLDGGALRPAIHQVLPLAECRAVRSRDDVADGDEHQPPAAALLFLDGQDGAGALHGVAGVEGGQQRHLAPGPHAARQVVHGGQEAAAPRMAVRSQAVRGHPVLEQRPMPARRHLVRHGEAEGGGHAVQHVGGHGVGAGVGAADKAGVGHRNVCPGC